MVHPYFMFYAIFFKLRWQMGGKSTELQQIQPVKPPIPLTANRLFHNEPCPGTYRHNVSFLLYILARSARPSLWPGWSAYRKYTPYSAPGNQ